MRRETDCQAQGSTSMLSSHPMELIPFFRQFRQSWMRDVLYTFFYGAAFALLFGLLNWDGHSAASLLQSLWRAFVISECMAYLTHLLFEVSHMVSRPLQTVGRNWLNTGKMFVLATLGVYGGYLIGGSLLGLPGVRHDVFSVGGLIGLGIPSCLAFAAIFYAYRTRERDIAAGQRLAAERQRALEAEQVALTAQLRMLQAQIEPHFLYNTLANAVALIGPAPDRARTLLERLIDHLRASLTASRAPRTILSIELQSVRTYLALMQLRMDDRLRYRFDIDDQLGDLDVPPLLLQPLVENAIHHGLEPKIDGGEIVIGAKTDGDQLCIVVADTGAGFDPQAKPRPGGGVGLSNLRERLSAQYGSTASVTLTDNAPSGVKVTIRLPVQTRQDNDDEANRPDC